MKHFQYFLHRCRHRFRRRFFNLTRLFSFPRRFLRDVKRRRNWRLSNIRRCSFRCNSGDSGGAGNVVLARDACDAGDSVLAVNSRGADFAGDPRIAGSAVSAGWKTRCKLDVAEYRPPFNAGDFGVADEAEFPLPFLTGDVSVNGNAGNAGF